MHLKTREIILLIYLYYNKASNCYHIRTELSPTFSPLEPPIAPEQISKIIEPLIELNLINRVEINDLYYYELTEFGQILLIKLGLVK